MSQTDPYLSFLLGEEEYLLPLLKVQEVIPSSVTTPVPYAPAYFKGVLNLRGQMISVLDLGMKFGLKASAPTSETAVIILKAVPLCLGVIVDQIKGVIKLSQSEIHPPPNIEGNTRGDYILGIVRRGKNLVLLLDVDKTLCLEELKALHLSREKNQVKT